MRPIIRRAALAAAAIACAAGLALGTTPAHATGATAMVLEYNTGYCAVATGSAFGSYVDSSPCTGAQDQQWTVYTITAGTYAGYYAIVSGLQNGSPPENDLCITDAGGANARLKLEQCNPDAASQALGYGSSSSGTIWDFPNVTNEPGIQDYPDSGTGCDTGTDQWVIAGTYGDSGSGATCFYWGGPSGF